MKLYFMGKKTLMPKQKTLCQCNMKGGYVPLLLNSNQGAGMTTTMPRPADMTRAKELLGGLSIQPRKKKFISI